MAYYRRIREMREDHDLTQKAVAEMLGMKQPQYYRYEQGFRVCFQKHKSKRKLREYAVRQ